MIKDEGKRKVPITFRISKNRLYSINNECEARKLTLTELMNEMVEFYYKK